jgi:single-strand DNA-binding protein
MKVTATRVTLGADPELTYANSGTAIVSAFVAENRRKKKGDEWVNETSWFNLKAFGKTAEWMSQDLSKGDSLAIDGEYVSEQYVNKDGEKKTSHTVFVNAFSKLAPRNND